MEQKSLNISNDDFTLKKSTRNLLESNQGFSNLEINNLTSK
jgi:hypothetical protein